MKRTACFLIMLMLAFMCTLTAFAAHESELPLAPSAKNLTYNGRFQPLIYNRVVSGVGYLYSLDGESWSNSLPTARSAGKYTVYYKTVDKGTGVESDVATVDAEIARAKLTVTAENKIITYGEKPVGNGVLFDGFVNNEKPMVLSGTLEYEFDYKQFRPVGNYEIVPSGLTSDNYDITYVSGQLKVIKEPLVIRIDDKTSIEHQSTEPLTYSIVSGKFYVDDSNDLVLKKAPGNKSGRYEITAELNNMNYEMTVIAGTYTILQKNISIEDNGTGLRAVSRNGQNPDSVMYVDELVADRFTAIRISDVSGENMTIKRVYDISLQNKEESATLDGTVTVFIPMPDDIISYLMLKVIFIDETYNAHKVEFRRENGMLVFETDKLGMYAVTGTKSLSPIVAYAVGIAMAIILVISIIMQGRRQRRRFL